jgi:hypothetical protein
LQIIPAPIPVEREKRRYIITGSWVIFADKILHA